jgi:two-component system sensor histidine kinase UhpB
MSLKLLLNLMITALMALMLLGGTLMTIHNAHDDIRAEVESTAAIAMHLIDKELLYLADQQPRTATPFGLRNLGNVRHLRVEYFDKTGQLRDSNQLKAPPPVIHPPPGWFIEMMGLFTKDIVSKRRPVFVDGNEVGEIVITADTSYEITEVWKATLGLLALAGMFFIAVNIMVYWAVDRALRPVNQILEAINAVEQGQLSVRLPAFRLPELAKIGRKFNDMAQALQNSISNNHRLSQKLIHLQEEERKTLARDLHDEIGQSLTAIHTDAAVILNASTRNANVKNSAQAIVEVSRHVMTMVRSMLERLRPESLDKLGLKAALEDLVETWQQRYMGTICKVQIAEGLNDLPEHVAIAAYRIVQECLTNVARHADATTVTVTVWQHDARLTLVVEDDGRGFEMGKADGLGLVGMRERAEGLGGDFELKSAPDKGTCIMVRIPLA